MYLLKQELFAAFLPTISFVAVQECKTLCAIWYHLYNLRNVKNTYERVLLLVKLQATLRKAWNFTKSNTAPWIYFTFFKLYKWYQIV